jgi:type II secretory pathway pseudopilin PulG
MKNIEAQYFGRTARGGFTIVEAVMVMVILAMFGMIAVPRYAAFTATEELEGAARRITTDLSLAQRRARQSSASQTVTFDVAQSRYSLVGMQHPDHPGQPFEIRVGDEPYRARIVSASFGGDATLVYDGFGKPDSGGQVVIAVGAYQKTIQVDSGTGQPRNNGELIIWQDPNPQPLPVALQ